MYQISLPDVAPVMSTTLLSSLALSPLTTSRAVVFAPKFAPVIVREKMCMYCVKKALIFIVVLTAIDTEHNLIC